MVKDIGRSDNNDDMIVDLNARTAIPATRIPGYEEFVEHLNADATDARYVIVKVVGRVWPTGLKSQYDAWVTSSPRNYIEYVLKSYFRTYGGYYVSLSYDSVGELEIQGLASAMGSLARNLPPGLDIAKAQEIVAEIIAEDFGAEVARRVTYLTTHIWDVNACRFVPRGLPVFVPDTDSPEESRRPTRTLRKGLVNKYVKFYQTYKDYPRLRSGWPKTRLATLIDTLEKYGLTVPVSKRKADCVSMLISAYEEGRKIAEGETQVLKFSVGDRVRIIGDKSKDGSSVGIVKWVSPSEKFVDVKYDNGSTAKTHTDFLEIVPEGETPKIKHGDTVRHKNAPPRSDYNGKVVGEAGANGRVRVEWSNRKGHSFEFVESLVLVPSESSDVYETIERR